MNQSICFTTRFWKTNSSVVLQEKVLISICNKVKSECFGVTCPKRVAPYPASLNVVTEDNRA